MNDHPEVEELLKRFATSRQQAAGARPITMPGPMRELLRKEIDAVHGTSESFEEKTSYGLSRLLRLLVPIAALATIAVVSYHGWELTLPSAQKPSLVADVLAHPSPSPASLLETKTKLSLEVMSPSPSGERPQQLLAEPTLATETPTDVAIPHVVASPQVSLELDPALPPTHSFGVDSQIVHFSTEREGILSTFEMERRERQVTFFDSDGSIFEGLTAIGADGKQVAEETGVGFVLQGFSETLQKEVRVTGFLKLEKAAETAPGKYKIQASVLVPGEQTPLKFEAAQSE